MPNFIDEYLIKLGGYVDQSGMSQFRSALSEAALLVDSRSIQMARSFGAAQAEIIGGFAAIGTATIGLLDKTAMADQSFRLFALHMYLSKERARELKVTMDALGEPLENLSWDAELRARAERLIALQRAMAPEAEGGDFEEQMRRIRDIRAEFTAMEIELQYLGMHVASDFMTALGMGPADLLARLRGFNDWVSTHLPEISKRIVTDFMPVWVQLKNVTEATGDALKSAGLLFTNLVGLFSGDTSIEGTSFNLDKMTQALAHVVGGFGDVVTIAGHGEAALAHFTNALVMLSQANLKAANVEARVASGSISTKEGMEILGGLFGLVTAGPWGAVIGAGAMHEFATADERTTMNKTGAFGAGPAYHAAMARGAMQVAARASVDLGVPADVLWAQMAHETGGFSHFAGVNNLAGIKVPGTNAYKDYGSLEDFLSDYESVLHESRYAGLGDTRDVASYAAVLKRGGYYGDTLANYTSGMSRWDKMYKSGDVNMGGVIIHVVQQPGESGRDLADRVTANLVATLHNTQGKATQRAQLHFQSLGTAQ
jgi:Mannosyl-glycoprotein endo-beta-N-acetylglucosaminidase